MVTGGKMTHRKNTFKARKAGLGFRVGDPLGDDDQGRRCYWNPMGKGQGCF